MEKSAILDLNMRLGEGTGAALALSIIRGAVACHNNMATFDLQEFQVNELGTSPSARRAVSVDASYSPPAGNLGLNVPKLASAVWFFPIVGIPIGLLVGLTYIATYNLGILPILASILAFSIGILVTGAMHEDGLADCATDLVVAKTSKQNLRL